VIVELRAARRTFRRGGEDVVAVRDASLAVAPGSLVVVRGPSGSGKTTLLNLLLGWERPDAGEVVRAPDGSADRAAVVPQRLGLLDHLTVAENIALARRAGGADSDTEAPDPLDLAQRLELDHLARRFPPETSLGEQQRVACARALVAARPLLIADEPTSHQDGARAALVVDELDAAARAGAAVVVATHDPRVSVRADVLVTMVDGTVTIEW
jgi:putative ABC transport system ATP-binding protein